MLWSPFIAGVVNQPLSGRGARSRAALLVVVVLLAAAGCVRMAVAPDDKHAIETTLFTTTANGQTSLSWTSRTNLTYTLLVAESWNAMSWQAAPECVNQRGTGGVMQFTLKEEPGQKRFYKLLAQPLAKQPRK